MYGHGLQLINSHKIAACQYTTIFHPSKLSLIISDWHRIFFSLMYLNDRGVENYHLHNCVKNTDMKTMTNSPVKLNVYTPFQHQEY